MSLTKELPTSEDLSCLIRFGDLRNKLGEMLENVAARVFDPIDGGGPDEAVVVDEDFGGPNDSFRIWASAPPPPLTWLASRDEGSLFAMLGLDAGGEAPALRFDAGAAWIPKRAERRRLERPIWRASLQRIGFGFAWEDEELCVITKRRQLADPQLSTTPTDKHLGDLGFWIQTQLHLLLRECAPP